MSNIENFEHPFPITCGKLKRVKDSNLVEPDNRLGYLYLLKSHEPQLIWSLSWEEISSNNTNTDNSENERWYFKQGKGELRAIEGRSSFYLKDEEGKMSLFWFKNENENNLKKAFHFFNTLFKVGDSNPIKDWDLFSISDDETAEEKEKRLNEARMLSNTIPTNLQSIVNLDPIDSSLKKYNISNNIQLNSVFQPNQLSNLLDDPGVTEKLLPLIPVNLRSQGKEGIQQVLNSESFQQLVHRLQQGLEMGTMSPLTVSLNLGVNGGRGVAQLVSSIQNKADKQWEKEVEKRMK